MAVGARQVWLNVSENAHLLQSQVCGSSLGENTVFMLEVAGEWPDTWHTLGTLVQPVHGLNATAEPEHCC